MNRKLVIIDGNSLLYRAFYALPALSKNGVYTNAVYGFLQMIYGMYRTMDPEYVAVCFDKDKQTFRMDLYADYKGTRKPAPDELVPQFALIRDVLRVMGVAQYELSGYEGDDLIGTLAEIYQSEMPVSIITGDRDALQLVSDRVTVYLTHRGTSDMAAMTPESVFEKYGITPSQVVDLKALMGDASDNIPGIAGVGEKTAVKLLSQYKTLDGVYTEAEHIGGKLGEKIRAGKEAAYLSQKLATIRRDVPLSASLDEMKKPAHTDEMAELFARLGLRKSAKDFSELPRFSALAKESSEEMSAETEILPWDGSADFSGKPAALSLHITGEAPFLSWDTGAVCCEGKMYRVTPECAEDVAAALSHAPSVWVAGAKEIIEAEFPTAGISFSDAQIAAYVADPTRVSYPLSVLADVFDAEAVFTDAAEADKAEAMRAGFLLALHPKIEAVLKERGLSELFSKIEMPLVPVLAAMERAGIATDEARWQEVLEDGRRRERLILKDIYTEAGTAFNVNSPKQLGQILFENLRIPAGKKTKSGYSTSADVLENLADEYAIVRHVLAYRSLSKLVSTYLEALPQLIRKDTDRIHTSFNQTATATGRLSSSNPNLQNIPVRTEEGRNIRSLFVPGFGYDCFLSADYSQVELRVMAHMSGDADMVAAFRAGEDIHRRTAAEVLGILPEDVTAEERSHAKAVNFGIVYGISDYGLSKQLGITKKAAADYIAAYFARYPRIREFMNELTEKARETGYAVTLFGRRRQLPDIRSKNFLRRSFAERAAMNTPIQGTAADIMKLAMIETAKRLAEGGFRSRILLQVHDELVLEAVKSEVPVLSAILKDAMEGAAKLSVPLRVDIHTGNNWAEAK